MGGCLPCTNDTNHVSSFLGNPFHQGHGLGLGSFCHQDLDWCNIQAEGAIALAQHLPPKVLRLWLGLGGCSIGREGAQALARALTYMSKLERLHLDCSRCRISNLAI